MAQQTTVRDPEFTVDPLWEGSCRCGQEVIVAEDEYGTPMVLHKVPQCPDYEKRDILGFLRWLREPAN